MTGFEAYQLFQSLKLHFSSEVYDFFAYNGKIKTTLSAFNRRNDRYFYEKLARVPDLKNFIIAQTIDGDIPKWVGDLTSNSEAENVYKNWLKRQQSLTYKFQEDLKELWPGFDANFKVEDGRHPKIMRLFLANKICYETLVILDDLVWFAQYLDKQLSDDVVWEKLSLKIRKYKPFLNYDKETMKNLVLKNKYFA